MPRGLATVRPLVPLSIPPTPRSSRQAVRRYRRMRETFGAANRGGCVVPRTGHATVAVSSREEQPGQDAVIRSDTAQPGDALPSRSWRIGSGLRQLQRAAAGRIASPAAPSPIRVLRRVDAAKRGILSPEKSGRMRRTSARLERSGSERHHRRKRSPQHDCESVPRRTQPPAPRRGLRV